MSALPTEFFKADFTILFSNRSQLSAVLVCFSPGGHYQDLKVKVMMKTVLF